MTISIAHTELTTAVHSFLSFLASDHIAMSETLQFSLLKGIYSITSSGCWGTGPTSERQWWLLGTAVYIQKAATLGGGREHGPLATMTCHTPLHSLELTDAATITSPGQ